MNAEKKIFGKRNGPSATTSLILPGKLFLLDTYNEAQALKRRTSVKSFKEREVSNDLDDTGGNVL